MIVRHQPANLAAVTNDDLGFKGKLACQFSAELRPSDRPSDHEGTRRSDAYNIEMFQSLGERTRPKGFVTANIHPSQKDHESHECLLPASRER
jgi:hypothetical protein